MDTQASPTVTVDFALGIGVGQFKASATVPAGQTNLTQILPVLQSLQDAYLDGVIGEVTASGQAVSCRAGCGACCRQMAPLTLIEAEWLSGWIRSLPEPRRRELAGRFEQAVQALTASGLRDRMGNQDWLAGTASVRQLGIEYFSLGIPCPFLEDESCSIHSMRPLICREYLVTTPAANCADPAALGVTHVPMALQFPRVLSRMGAEAGGKSRGWIPLLFLFEWMETGATPGQAVAGEGPRVLFEFVKRLAGSALAAPEP